MIRIAFVFDNVIYKLFLSRILGIAAEHMFTGQTHLPFTAHTVNTNAVQIFCLHTLHYCTVQPFWRDKLVLSIEQLLYLPDVEDIGEATMV